MSKENLNEETQQEKEISENDLARKFASFQQIAKEKKVYIPTCYRVLVRSYIQQNLIAEYEYEDVLNDIARVKDTKFNRFILDFFCGLLGWFILPFAIRKMENSLLALQFESQEDKFEQLYMQKMQQKLLER
jgi:hypothetical protein